MASMARMWDHVVGERKEGGTSSSLAGVWQAWHLARMQVRERREGVRKDLGQGILASGAYLVVPVSLTSVLRELLCYQ